MIMRTIVLLAIIILILRIRVLKITLITKKSCWPCNDDIVYTKDDDDEKSSV